MAWPFEGRDHELALIASAFSHDSVAAVVLAAPAGVGKTRLAREALSGLAASTQMDSAADGVRTWWLSATRAGASIPFGAVEALLPEGPLPPAPLDLVRAVAGQVLEWGGRHAVAIAVDDAHLLDDASSTLIAHLISNRFAFVIMTVRSGEPLADVLSGPCDRGDARRIELAPLADDVMDRLIDHALPDDPGLPRRRRLREVAQGNPLALRELLHGAQPGGLAELVAARLSGLDRDTRHVVELVACGEPLSLTLLERSAGLAAVEAAEESGLIVLERSGARVNARLDHPLFGELLRSSLSVSRTTRIYRALADALLATGLRRRSDTLLAATWQVEAGSVRRPDVVRAGAWQAIGHASLELAERLARAARMAEPGDEADRILAEILAYRGRSTEAIEVLSATPPSEPEHRAAWAITRAGSMYWGDEDLDRADAVLVDNAGGDDAAEATRAWLLFFDGQCAEAARLARSVMNRPGAEPQSVVWAAAAGCGANGFLGRLDEAERIRRRGAAVAAQLGDELPWGSFEVDAAACLAYLAGGQPAVARAIADAGYRGALDGGAPMMVTGWAFFRGLAAVARGQVDEAGRLLAEASAGFETNDTFRMGRCCLAARAGAAAVRGDPDARTFMDRADALAHASNRVLAPWIGVWSAWTAYADGDLAAATADATGAADLARDAGMPPVEAFARYELVRLGARTDLARLEEIDDDLARLLATAARALACHDGARALESAGHALHERGFDLYAAEAFTTAAHRHHRLHRFAQADLARGHAARLQVSMPARTPLLLPGHLSGLLTPREREILLLAAEHTSAEIAARLKLALPTVNNNLARAYGKLGLKGRSQLRELLRGGSAPEDGPRVN